MDSTVLLPNGIPMPELGQGTWRMGEDTRKEKEEIEALRTGIGLGMTLIDTAEMYGEGRAELLVGKALDGIERKKVFLVSKVYPHHAGKVQLPKACEQSLKRLNTDYLDLYLLHWRGRIPLAETVAGMEELVRQGYIRQWGVSNFDTDDMKELWKTEGGSHCVTDQILYHLGSRGAEYDLIPWLAKHHLPFMAYSPIAQAGILQQQLLANRVLQQIAVDHRISVIQLLLAFVLHQPGAVAIPKAATSGHVRENAAAGKVQLTQKEWAEINREFPAPFRKIPLDII